MFVPNFENLGQASSWEIFDQNFHIHYIGEKEKREK